MGKNPSTNIKSNGKSYILRKVYKPKTSFKLQSLLLVPFTKSNSSIDRCGVSYLQEVCPIHKDHVFCPF